MSVEDEIEQVLQEWECPLLGAIHPPPYYEVN